MVLRARPMAPAGDGPYSAVGTLTDISRMKRTEASLRANRRSLSMLLSNVPGMVYRCRHDRNWFRLRQRRLRGCDRLRAL